MHDVIIRPQQELTPDLEEGERLRLERAQRRTIQLFEQGGARLSRGAPQRLGVQAGEQSGQQDVHLTERHRRSIRERQPQQALNQLHADLHLGLVGGTVGPGRTGDRSVMIAEGLERRIDYRRLTALMGYDRGLEVVRDDHLRDAAEEAQRLFVRPDPVCRAL